MSDIEYIKDQIEQALFFLEYQAVDFPVESALKRTLELIELQKELRELTKC